MGWLPGTSEHLTKGGIRIAGEASIEQVITRRRARVITRAGYRRLAVRLIYLAVICYLLFTYCFLITQCHGQDMFPAMLHDCLDQGGA